MAFDNLALQILIDNNLKDDFDSLFTKFSVNDVVKQKIENLIKEAVPPDPHFFKGIINIQREHHVDHLFYVYMMNFLSGTNGMEININLDQELKKARAQIKRAEAKLNKITAEKTTKPKTIKEVRRKSINKKSSVNNIIGQHDDPESWYVRALNGESRWGGDPLLWDLILFKSVNRGPVLIQDIAEGCGVTEDRIKLLLNDQYDHGIVKMFIKDDNLIIKLVKKLVGVSR